MKGSCKECIEIMQKYPKIGDYCCFLCALGLSKESDKVIKDPFTGTTHVEVSHADR